MEEVQKIPSVTLKPLKGMENVDLAAATDVSAKSATLGALLRLCANWQNPSATTQGRCWCLDHASRWRCACRLMSLRRSNRSAPRTMT